MRVQFYSRIAVTALIIFGSVRDLPAVENLKSTENRADYLMILRQDFLPELEPLIKHRQLEGYRIEPVFLSDIQREFRDADDETEQIRAFVRYALEQWQKPAPGWLLLVGDSDIIPAHLEFYGHDDIAMDAWYGIDEWDTEGFSDIAIGRFPVSNRESLSMLVDKTVRFEYQSADVYDTDYFFVADYWPQTRFLFEERTEQFIHDVIPQDASYLRLDLNPESLYAGDSLDFQTLIARSPRHVLYFGHGNQTVWSHCQFLNMGNIEDMIHNQFPFVLTTYTCSQTFLGDGPQSLVEQMLLMPVGGAVATFAPTGENFESPGAAIVRAFHETALSDPQRTLGEVMQISKQQVSHTMNRQFTLLGDPALKIPVSILADTEGPDVQLPAAFQVEPNYPNPFNARTTLSFNLPRPGDVRLQIFDVQGRNVLDRELNFPNAGPNRFVWNAADFPSGLYIARIGFGGVVRIQKMQLMK